LYLPPVLGYSFPVRGQTFLGRASGCRSATAWIDPCDNPNLEIRNAKRNQLIQSPVLKVCNSRAYEAAGAAASAAPSFFSAAGAGAALGLPGLGRRSDLCSMPLFFRSDETVSDGTAPVSSQYLQRSSLAMNCLALSLFRGS